MGMNMVTTVMAFSVSAFFVLFVFLRLLCARLRLRTDHAAGDAFVVQAYNVERGIHGLEPSVMTSFPTVKLGDGRRGQCPVCLEDYAAKDVLRVLPACGHAFHAACIDAWLRQHPTCPVCRASLRATTKNHRRATPLEHSLSAAAATPPAPVPASSSSPPYLAEADADQTDTGIAGRLEIVPEEPDSSADQQQRAGVVDRYGCGETATQSASEHR